MIAAAGPAGPALAPRPAPAARRPLLEHALIVVTGKGGTGKSTVAAAIALEAARRGRRAIVVEVAGRDDVRRVLTGSGGGPLDVERPLAAGVDHLSIDAHHALADYVHRYLPRPAAALLLAGGAFELLAAATPGLAELLMIGKVWQLTQPDAGGRRAARELVILDAPATGHGLALLRSAGTFAAAARAGPVGTRARRIDADLRDPARTAVLAVTAPEELAVAEALQLRDELARTLGVALHRVVVDAVLPDRFTAAEEQRLAAAPPAPWQRVVLSAAARAHHQQRELRRLRAAIGEVPVTTLPFVFEPVLGPAAIARLGTLLGRAGG